MKKQLFAILLLMSPALALASSGGVHLDNANIDPTNKESLQRGARTFVNYCMGCHSAKYQRYNRMARDLGMTNQDVIDNLMFAGDQVGAHMETTMSRAAGKAYFGAPPPDLTLVSRVRGNDWLYTYLRTFYLDSSRPFGVNNEVFDNVGMPNVMWELQGWQKPVYKTVIDDDGHEYELLEGVELVEAGSQTPAEFDRTVRDLVNFLDYIAEPIRQERQALGVKVLLFLFVLFILAYLLKKEFWKDIH